MRRTLISLALLLAIPAAACSGGDDSDGQVASIDGEAAADGATNGGSDGEATEEEMLEYTECLRDQGLDVEDPVVDADGNVQFGGGFGGDGPPDEDFREQFQEAQEVCGEPPGGGFAGRSGMDQSEMQDQMLEFAECMRDHGIDMPDPDFSGEGGFPAPGGDDGEGGGPFGDIDRDDPAFQEASDECGGAFGGGFGPGADGEDGTDDSDDEEAE